MSSKRKNFGILFKILCQVKKKSLVFFEVMLSVKHWKKVWYSWNKTILLCQAQEKSLVFLEQDDTLMSSTGKKFGIFKVT